MLRKTKRLFPALGIVVLSFLLLMGSVSAINPLDASLLTPVDNSWASSITNSLSVQVWENDTSKPVTVDFYIYYSNAFNEWDNITSTFSGTNDTVPNGSIAYFNFTVSCPGTLYAWFVKLSSWWDFNGDGLVNGSDISDFYGQTGAPGWIPADLIANGVINFLDLSYFTAHASLNALSIFYPQSGYNWSADAGSPDPSCDFVWRFNSLNNSYPVTTITYPANGASYTSFAWQKAGGHNLTFTTSDAEGDLISCLILISNKYGDIMDDAFHNVHNGTYTLDLKPWITFDNMSYNISIFSEDDAHCSIATGTWSYSAFYIGSANTKTHLSVKDCYPPDGDDNAIGAINTGITFDACTNITQSGAPTIWLFLIDMDKTQQGMLVGGTPYWFNPVTAMGSRYCNYVISNTEVWRHFSFAKGFLQVRHTYKVYVGIFSSGDPPGKTTIGVSPASRIEADFIYDLSARPMSFSYEFKNFDVPKKNEIIEDLSNGDAHFVGVTWEFSTYPAGETPVTGDIGDTTTGSTWGRTLFAHVDTGLVSWLELIAGLFVVAMFTVMPYILLKKKWSGRNVAMPINITFTAFGLVMAYGMGLLPLWIFIPPVFIIMVILVYKITVWITSRKQLIGGEEGGA